MASVRETTTAAVAGPPAPPSSAPRKHAAGESDVWPPAPPPAAAGPSCPSPGRSRPLPASARRRPPPARLPPSPAGAAPGAARLTPACRAAAAPRAVGADGTGAVLLRRAARTIAGILQLDLRLGNTTSFPSVCRRLCKDDNKGWVASPVKITYHALAVPDGLEEFPLRWVPIVMVRWMAQAYTQRKETGFPGTCTSCNGNGFLILHLESCCFTKCKTQSLSELT
ncbi:uncharacterized protein GJ701_001291 [Geothlypis trichas]